VVLTDLQGKGPCGKEASLLKALLLTFGATNGEALLSAFKKQTTAKKVMGPCGQ
jgi:hypothetical protein